MAIRILMPDKEIVAFRDVLEFASGLTFQQLEKSCLHQNAILKSIEIIREVTTHVGT